MRPTTLLAWSALLGTLVVLLAVPATASGGQATGCPAYGNPGGNSGVRNLQLMTIPDAVARSVAQITDAWYVFVGTTKAQVIADRTAGMTQQDKNADGLLCVAELWGTELNPNSHWAQFWGDLLNPPEPQVFVVFDNHMGTSTDS
jgi:hypothetical protein